MGWGGRVAERMIESQYSIRYRFPISSSVVIRGHDVRACKLVNINAQVL